MAEAKNVMEEVKQAEPAKMDSPLENKAQNRGTEPSRPKAEDTSTNNNKLNSKASSNSLTDESQEMAVVDPEVWSFVLKQLARQLEYYLSEQNLSKDTYVQTLRNLNDGCVPVSILANFSKVKNILLATAGIGDEARRTQAVWEAANEHSSKLRCVNVDTKTGKETLEGSSAGVEVNTIRAIGTVDNQPIAELEAPPSPLQSSSEQFANAIVLRDVPPEVTPEEIHVLFQYEGCPAVISIVPDVANCWFVQLEATRRSDVMQVLLQLRGETLAGFPVHARIKTSVATSSVLIDAAPLMVAADWQAAQQVQQQKSNKNGSKGEQSNRRKKKHQRNKNKKKNGNNNNSENSGSKNNSNASQDSERNTTNRRDSSNSNSSSGSNKKNPTSTPCSASSKKKIVAPPPSLCEQDFPTLVDNRVEWETTPVQDEEKKKEVTSEGSVESKAEEEEEAECGIKSVKIGSDSASTATTTSTSTEPGPKKVGYAAALKNKPASSTSSIASTSSNNSASPKSVEAAEASAPAGAQNTTETRGAEASPMVVKPPSWGAGRSFADILRQAQTAS